MRLHTLAAGGLIGLCFLAEIAFADVPRGLPAPILAGYSPYQDTLEAPFHSRDVMTPEQLGVMRSLLRGPDPSPAPTVPEYTRAWIDAQPVAGGDAQWECLAQAIYFESRGESIRGQFAVAEVILNRVDSPLYPRSICHVVRQGGAGGCQFSFTCDGRKDRIRDRDAYAVAGKIARVMLDGAPRALTDGATHFHTRNVRPRWSHRMPKTASIGAHLFYRVASGG